MTKRSNQVKWARFRAERYDEYLALALDLFDERGYQNVTVSDIAAAAGVTARTLYRYFPTKEDLVLAVPRRSLDMLVEEIGRLEPDPDPVSAVWSLLEKTASNYDGRLEASDKWRRVVVAVPEIRARVRGERMSVLMEVLTEYCERSLGLEPGTDVRPRAMAGMLCGAELGVMTFWGGARADIDGYFAESAPVLIHGASVLEARPPDEGCEPSAVPGSCDRAEEIA